MKKSSDQKPHVVWIIIDSVRRYHTDDDRSRLDYMDEFAKHAVEFSQVVTSAPSTVMSISAMMNSIPAYFIGRNYNDFRFDNDFFVSLPKYLKSQGYKSNALIMHKDIREKLTFFDLVPRKYWPPGYSHGDWWSNEKIFKLLKNCLLNDNIDDGEPKFWFVDYNCREDKNISSIVEASVNTFYQNGYNKDNTVFIICSDHGYPDPSKGITPQLLKQKNMTHDIFMTDDNIMIPLLISYPGCKPGLKINETVSTLDIAPTILDVLGLPLTKEIRKQWKGRSLKPLLENKNSVVRANPLIRTDARFMGQSGRVSSIRSKHFKYIYFHDDRHEAFFQVGKNVEDEIEVLDLNIKTNRQKFEAHRNEFEVSEREGKSFQADYLIYKFKKQKGNFKRFDQAANLKILLVTGSQRDLICLIIEALKKSFGNATIHLFSTTSLAEKNNADVFYKTWPEIEKSDVAEFDLAFISNDTSGGNPTVEIKKLKRIVRVKKFYELDLNMTVSVKLGQLARYLRTLWFNRKFFIQEPLLIFKEITKVIRLLVVRLKLG
jgi:hypothetical protein